MTKQIEKLGKNIIRVTCNTGEYSSKPSDMILQNADFSMFVKEPELSYFEAEDSISFLFDNSTIINNTKILFNEKEIYSYHIDGEPVYKTKQTANGEVTYIENCIEKPAGYSYSCKLSFEIGDNELLLGLGQYEDGIFNYRNRTEYLYESNMRIAIPLLLTNKGYGIFIDSFSNMIFTSKGNKVTFDIDTAPSLSFYVFTGNSLDSLIKTYQALTGNSAMLPRWAFGYIQSKERYCDAKELVSTAKDFRERRIPIDCIVQDWQTWDEGLWGEKIFDKKRYPDFPGTIKELHDINVKSMVSIWPNMSPAGENIKEFAKENGLLKNSNTYDAFNEAHRNLYWEQCMREIMSSGNDSLWCDNAEPFSDADWNGKFKRPEELRYELVVNDSKHSMDLELINAYGLYHAKGIYENWRKTIKDKRVVNLTRSGYASIQKYGAILWSGDISANWNTLKHQVTEGLKMGICGMPYWTLDIGAFFVQKIKYDKTATDFENPDVWFWNGDYNNGINDPGYRELYTRWLQFGAFLPIFRSHGTDTPREPWNFINKDDVTLPFYETILKFISLRYSLMPYIYSCAYKAHMDSYIIMRALVFDFADDEKAIGINDEYMFGDSFLVAPVYRPMYYLANGEKISDVDTMQKVYLPKGCGWYNYWTKEYYEGGQTILCDAPIDRLPLFVKEGAIIPYSDGISYADEKSGEITNIEIYSGCNSEYVLYNDEGNSYEFEEGWYSKTTFAYKESTGDFSLINKEGKLPIQKRYSISTIQKDGTVKKAFITI